MSEITDRRLCTVCGDGFEDGEDPHFLHREDCTEGCDCDRPVHAECCTEEGCR